MEILAGLLIIAFGVLIYKKLTAEKPDGNKTQPAWKKWQDVSDQDDSTDPDRR